MNFELEKSFLKSQAEERDAWSPDSTGAMQVGQVKDLKKRMIISDEKDGRVPDQPIVDTFCVVKMHAGQVTDRFAFFKVFKANGALIGTLFFFGPFCDLEWD